MIGSLLQAAREDYVKIASAGGFEVSAILATPTGDVSLPVIGLATGTWMVFDNLTSGKPVNSQSNSFNIPEAALIAANYPYKNVAGTVYVKNHTVTILNDDGLSGTFVIGEQHYNATLGMVICIIGKKSS